MLSAWQYATFDGLSALDSRVKSAKHQLVKAVVAHANLDARIAQRFAQLHDVHVTIALGAGVTGTGVFV
jgi:hypothetical protein